MNRKYWLDLSNLKTWEEFINAGAEVVSYRMSKLKCTEKIKPGDYLLCYVTGISRFIGVLEVKSEHYIDESRDIHPDDDFPVRFRVKLLHKLTPETAIPVHDLFDKLSFLKDMKTPEAFGVFFISGLKEYSERDGEIVLRAIQNAEKNPVVREYDKKKYYPESRKHSTGDDVVTIPEDIGDEIIERDDDIKITHEEIQYRLLKLGSDMGMDIWAAKNDKNKEFNGVKFQEIPKTKISLPIQFDPATNRTIELIDVLWLKGNAIIAAFEVEHSTNIYSGLLRMADLISMQPNIDIKLFIVAPDQRRKKVLEEINRPVFKKLPKPLPEICRFIPYSELVSQIDKIGDTVKFMKLEFIEDLAEHMQLDDS